MDDSYANKNSLMHILDIDKSTTTLKNQIAGIDYSLYKHYAPCQEQLISPEEEEEEYE